MILWSCGALGLFAVFALACCAALRGSDEMRVVGLQFAGAVAGLALVLLALAQGSPDFIDVALTLAVLSAGSGLLFARFIERLPP